MVSSRLHAQHREGPPSSVGVGMLCRRERQRKGESPYLFLELGDLAFTFSSQHQSPPGPQASGLMPHCSGIMKRSQWYRESSWNRAVGALGEQPSYQPVLVHVLGAFRA